MATGCFLNAEGATIDPKQSHITEVLPTLKRASLESFRMLTELHRMFTATPQVTESAEQKKESENTKGVSDGLL